MPMFTCITCRVSFADSDIQRRHYKTDWHRYNLKRKVAEMPPVTAEVFQQKVLAQKAEVEAQQQSKTKSLHCQLCNKTFSSENAHGNHLSSKKHKDLEANKAKKQGSLITESQLSNNFKRKDSKETDQQNTESENAESLSHNGDDDDDDDDDDDIEEDTLEVTDCLFCPHHSVSLEENLKHMTRSHSFFIPDLEYVVDLKGLVTYLCEKVGMGNMCLYCNDKGKSFFSLEAVQSHMVDKGHTKMNYEGDAVLEYADFYDFSSSYPDYNPDEENEGDEIQGRDSTLAVNEQTLELCLPSGAKIGHRNMRHIYKQNLPPERSHHSKVIQSIMADYKALGWHGTIASAARQKVKDVRLRNVQQAKRNVDISVKANRMQKHFRPQVVF
ncbi:cytoplasmic 60S subunit biogenesis factor ZNF622-like [Porites lutea]|uniref:cytoplasmic 60S subunit biogenesis factor ZNF622-like n=1 Tax=Porites lutea TaxID=51062 RepID=UPI003CC5DAF1